MVSISVSNLAVIPYLNHSTLAGRALYSFLFYDGEWRSWLDANGQLIETRMWPAETAYFGSKPAVSTDICLHFLDIIAQRICFEEMAKPFFALHDDIFNLSASLAKIELLHNAKACVGPGAPRMAATEIEYIYGVCRSIFDLWQEIIIKLWDSVELIGSGYEKREPKESYADMLYSGGSRRTSEELTKRFGMPGVMAECYTRSADFFTVLRKLRDNLIHRGSSVQLVFDGDTDFFIQEASLPFKMLPIWKSEDRAPNGLVALRPALAYVICQTLGTCDQFSRTIEASFSLPPPIVPGMNLFLRGYFDESLMRWVREIQRRITPPDFAEQ
jgi:hypothetical protein